MIKYKYILTFNFCIGYELSAFPYRAAILKALNKRVSITAGGSGSWVTTYPLVKIWNRNTANQKYIETSCSLYVGYIDR